MHPFVAPRALFIDLFLDEFLAESKMQCALIKVSE
jgi:hypothetical protein